MKYFSFVLSFVFCGAVAAAPNHNEVVSWLSETLSEIDVPEEESLSTFYSSGFSGPVFNYTKIKFGRCSMEVEQNYTFLNFDNKGNEIEGTEESESVEINYLDIDSVRVYGGARPIGNGIINLSFLKENTDSFEDIGAFMVYMDEDTSFMLVPRIEKAFKRLKEIAKGNPNCRGLSELF